MNLTPGQNPSYDFRSPFHVETAHQKADVICKEFGGRSEECLKNRMVANIVSQANHCYYDWNSKCKERLQGRLDLTTACSNGLYRDSPMFEKELCGQSSHNGMMTASKPLVVPTPVIAVAVSIILVLLLIALYFR